jgi:hypothetical protein
MAKASKKAVWLSFDLGVNGDYEGMYSWLATQDAKECGDSLAFFHFSPTTDLVAEIKKGIDKSVETSKKTRIYMIYLSDEGKVKGTFLFGGRRQAPWTGYGFVAGEGQTDEA